MSQKSKGKYALDSESKVEELIRTVVEQATCYIHDDDIKEEFHQYSMLKDFSSIGISEAGKVCHPFKVLSAAFISFRSMKDFKTTLTSLLMLGGYSSMTGCISGAILGCKYGFSQLPKHWIEGLNTQNKEWLNSKINTLLDMMGLP